MRPEAGPDLIERARRDRAAFGEIYDLYLRRVYAFCLAHSGGKEEAEDLTAQTFERALDAIDRYQERGVPFSAWLLRIAANVAVDRARRGGRITLLGDQSPPEQDASRSAQLGPEHWVERWERAAWLCAHLATLPEDQRQAIRLRFLEDQAVREVAARMDRSEGAVKQLLHRALTALRGRIHQEARADV